MWVQILPTQISRFCAQTAIRFEGPYVAEGGVGVDECRNGFLV
jgi:hypothetical protein